jgi:hypothetical protein
MTPDPYIASGGPADPGSWNRYTYTRGDPVNRFDPGGTCDQVPGYSITVCGGSLDPLTYNSLLAASTSPALLLDNWWSSQIAAVEQYYQNLQVQNEQAMNSILGQDLTLAENALKNLSCASLFGTSATRSGAWNPQTAENGFFCERWFNCRNEY